MVGVLVAETPGELQERAQAMLVEFGSGAATDGEAWLAERRGRWIMGTPDEAHDQISRFEAAGAQRIMFQDFLPRDLEMIGLLGRIARG